LDKIDNKLDQIDKKMDKIDNKLDKIDNKLNKIDKKLPKMSYSSSQQSPSSEKEEKGESEVQPQQISPKNLNKEMPLILGSESGSNKAEISSRAHSQKSHHA
jgi:hypothetical protein